MIKIGSSGLALLLILSLFIGIVVGMAIFRHHSPLVSRIAPTYALDKYNDYTEGNVWHINIHAPTFDDFWAETTKNTQFTIDGKPVEITDVQVFYKIKDNSCWQETYHADTGTWMTKYFYTYGNVTYYPLGIENSQTYIAPIPTPCIDISIKWSNNDSGNWTISNKSSFANCPTPSSSCPSRSCYDIITAPPCYVVPTPTPTPTPCVAITCNPNYPTPTPTPCVWQSGGAGWFYPLGIENIQTYVASMPTPTPTPCVWQSERTSYSFCGKVIVNSSAEFDRLLKDIEKHSYHIQMGWMHLDYEYAHKTYDNLLPAPVNIAMGIISGDNFPIGSEWEGRMAYVIDDCAPFGSCDFDKLALIPTPTPVFAFPYEFCGNGCLICTDHLGNCTYISGRSKPTPTPNSPCEK